MIGADFRVEPASWAADEAALRAVRERVFIVEQRIPEDEEWDALDERSRHVLARADDGTPIGCGRLTPDRTIGRMAVLAEWRGRGVGEALMHVLLEQARALRWPSLSLRAQTHAMPFYAKFGFAAEGDPFDECGIPHRLMRATLDISGGRQVASPAPMPQARILLAEDRAQALAATLQLLADTRHELALHTRDLDPLLLDVAESIEAIKRVALSGRSARVRVIVHEPRKAIGDGHRLIALAQRLPSAIELRTPIDERDLQYPSAYFVNDRRGYLFRPLASRLDGEGSTYAPGRHAQLLQAFDRVWERSAPSEDLRVLAF